MSNPLFVMLRAILLGICVIILVGVANNQDPTVRGIMGGVAGFMLYWWQLWTESER